MSNAKGQPEKARILIVDDHPLFMEALHQLIEHEPGWSVCGKATDATQALQLVDETKPDMVIVDISLGATNGIDLLRSISAKQADLPMLVVSMHNESLYAEKAIRAGAMGYVMKHEAPKTVKSAIQQVLTGEMFLSHKIATSLLAKVMREEEEEPEDSPMSRLSEREQQVFRLLGHGKSIRQIALELDLSITTIHSFRGRIKEKLHVKTSPELLLRAIYWVKEQTANNLPPSQSENITDFGVTG